MEKSEIAVSLLLVEWAKSASHVVVSAVICFEKKGQLHFVEEKVKINDKYYTNDLLQ